MATSNLPRDDFGRLIAEMQARIDRLERRSPFDLSGINIDGPGQVSIDGLLSLLGLTIVDANGGLQSSNYVTGVSGWRLNGSTLEANTGVIGNGALANPVSTQTVRASAAAFALTTSYVTLASVPVTVPTGFTTLQAQVFCKLYTVNGNTTGGRNGAGQDALLVQAAIGSSVSTATGWRIDGSNDFANAVVSESFNFTGLTDGQVLTVAVNGRSQYQGIPSTAGTYANVIASLTWTR